MPANLTPQFQKAERDFRRAQSLPEQIDCLQKMLQLIPKHKGTERMQANLKTRLREARQQLTATPAQRGGPSFRLPRNGAGRVVIVGAPNCGKSRLLATLTRAAPEISPWPFTTREPVPGMLEFHNIQIQLIDTPPIVPGSLEPWMLNLVRTADAALLVLDGSSDDGPLQTRDVISELQTRKTRLSEDSGFDPFDLAVLHVPTQLIVTHAADCDHLLRQEMLQEMGVSLPAFTVELDEPQSVKSLPDAVFRLLQIMRIYTRRPGADPDLANPVTLRVGSTVEDLALHLHEDLFHRLTNARLWRTDLLQSQMIGRHHPLQDGDVVELH